MTPPAAPTLHPKRCDCATCKKTDCEYYRYRDQFMSQSRDYGNIVLCSPMWVLSSVGCASHSSITPDADARQRIEDVVKELEKLKENYALHYTHKDEDDWNDDPTFGDGAVDACTKAIALLKDGVERK